MLAVTAFEGIILGMGIAFSILLMATQNIITAFMATFTIACSTVCVIGIIPLCGWKMGVSIGFVLILSLFAEYLLHVCMG